MLLLKYIPRIASISLDISDTPNPWSLKQHLCRRPSAAYRHTRGPNRVGRPKAHWAESCLVEASRRLERLQADAAPPHPSIEHEFFSIPTAAEIRQEHFSHSMVWMDNAHLYLQVSAIAAQQHVSAANLLRRTICRLLQGRWLTSPARTSDRRHEQVARMTTRAPIININHDPRFIALASTQGKAVHHHVTAFLALGSYVALETTCTRMCGHSWIVVLVQIGMPHETSPQRLPDVVVGRIWQRR